MADTLNERFFQIVDRRGDGTAFVVKRAGIWQRLSYRWALERVQRTAFGLRALGCAPQTHVAILSENRPEWATTDYGAMMAGCALVPLYTTLIPSQVEYILRDAEAKVVFVSSEQHLDTVLEIIDRVPTLERVITFDVEDPPEEERVMDLERLLAAGDGHSRQELEDMAAAARPEDVSTLVYTSGTTGRPKGVVLTHRNFIAELAAVEPLIKVEPDSVLMSFLPLSHILQRVADLFSFMYGIAIAYAESLDALGDNLREVRPTNIVGVPRVYEKIFARINEGVEKGPALKKRLFEWAVGVGRRYRAAEATGKVGAGLAAQHAVADRLVFSKIQAATGGRMRMYGSAGAPLAADLAEFFHAVGIKILEVYGMTELTGAVTVNTDRAFRFGSVGKTSPGVELRISDEGEVLVRGDVVMQGYWNMPAETAETIDPDGWLHTGDVGLIDDDGFVRITDRMKELIVTAGGKNVAPQPLENALKADKFIAQAMVIGDRRKFISALVVPASDVLEPWAKEQGIAGDLAALCADQRVVDHYQAVVDAKMGDFSRYERVKKIALLPNELTEEAGELTPTLKLKRRVILNKYAPLIDDLYAQPVPPREPAP